MLSLLRQPLLKSVKIAQFGVKKFAQPIPRVLQRSYGTGRPRVVIIKSNNSNRIFESILSTWLKIAVNGTILYYQWTFFIWAYKNGN